MKKLFALVVAGAMTLSLAACGAKTETPAATSTPAVSTPAASTVAPKELDYPTKNISWIVPVNAGTPTDLATRQLVDQLDLGVNIAVENVTGGKAVAYDGNNGSYQALLTGEVDFAISDDNFIYNYYNDGACNTIVCLANESSYYLPDVPAIGDYGIENMDALAGWKIVGVSADTPDEIVNFLKEKIDEVLASDVYAKYLLDTGCGAFSSIQSSEEITALVEDAFVLYEDILTAAGLM